MNDVEVIVIGAGPAGLSVAARLAQEGVAVLLLDEQSAAGGQIYRGVEKAEDFTLGLLGKDYEAGLSLTRELKSSQIKHVSNARVWRVDPSGTVAFSVENQAHKVTAQHVVIATGAIERAVPIPGWTLPGVMGVGAAQIMLKAQSIVPENAIVAGCGPLLYLYVQQLIASGNPPAALVETQSRFDWFSAVRYLPAALRSHSMLRKGLGLLKTVRQSGVPRYKYATSLKITGATQAEGLSFRCGNELHTIPAKTILLHQGIVPDTQISRSLRLPHRWSHTQKCFHPITDYWGATELPKISIAGDSARITGASAARLSGATVGLDVLYKLNRMQVDVRNREGRKWQKTLSGEQAARPFLDTLYKVSEELTSPANSTIVCRCESVTAGQIREAVDAGCTGPNQAKAYHRCGMGPCQGRYCGLSVTSIIAKAAGQNEHITGYYRIRSPLKPVTLAEVASLSDGE